MAIADEMKEFWGYIVWYPEEDEEGFDGIHYGGIKGISDNAPEAAKKAFYEYMRMQEEASKKGEKI